MFEQIEQPEGGLFCTPQAALNQKITAPIGKYDQPKGAHGLLLLLPSWLDSGQPAARLLTAQNWALAGFCLLVAWWAAIYISERTRQPKGKGKGIFALERGIAGEEK